MAKDILALHKYLVPLLSRYPDEVALIPNKDGWFPISIVVRVLHENSLFKWVRENHLLQLPHLMKTPLVEVHENLIRAKDISNLPFPTLVTEVPEILYSYCKPKRIHHVYQKGLVTRKQPLILSPIQEKALEIGKRFSPDPILLRIRTTQTSKTQFQQFGLFFLADVILSQAIEGPPVETFKLPKKSSFKPKEETFSMSISPGSCFIDGTKLMDKNKIRYVQKKGQKKKIEWKKERRKDRLEE